MFGNRIVKASQPYRDTVICDVNFPRICRKSLGSFFLEEICFEFFLIASFIKNKSHYLQKNIEFKA